MSRLACLGFGLLLLAPLHAAAEDAAAGSVSVRRLTMETALVIAKGAVEACRKKDIQIGVTVVDRNGTVQAQLRDTVAPPITLVFSTRKAYTAINFGVRTSQLVDTRTDSAIGRAPELLLLAGGVPIQAGGLTYGAVGVSGASSSETDEECAQAGARPVVEDLEMSD